MSRIDLWFIDQLQEVMEIQREVEGKKLEDIPAELLRTFKDASYTHLTLPTITAV